MLHIIKRSWILVSLFILSACGMDNQSAEHEASIYVEEETDKASEETNSEVNKNQKEVSTEEKHSKIEQDNELSEEPTTEETNTTVVNSDFQWIYNELTGKSFIFSSGVGAWRTAFTFTDNGHFSGVYSDANQSEINVSEFSGQFKVYNEIDEYTYQLILDEFQVTSETGKEETDGEMTIKYVAEPHGFQKGTNTFELYLPYKPKNEVSEEYLSWVFNQANNEYEFLNSFGLYNVTHQFGMEEFFD